MIPTIRGLVLGKRISTKNCSISFGKKCCLQVTYITSNVVSNTSNVSVPITSEQLVRYLDFRLKNGFINLRFRYSDNSGIGTRSYYRIS